ncbi:DnaJ domain-containing protein [Patescibacteria group bacterium]|nr:DnaJ domain-containing protein [Patescibacteria group bacterium]
MQELQPGAFPSKRRTAITPENVPEPTFHFEKKKLEDLKSLLETQNFYQRLGVPEVASLEEIKKAYYALAKDANPVYKPKELEGVYSEILRLYIEANNVLQDAGKRKTYDEMLHPIRLQPRDLRRMNTKPEPNPRNPRFDEKGRRRF